MATHQLAKGLASLGRHGDTMLMHVSPSEVAGLKAIGAMTGRQVSTNPHTGMPEAFNFGDFLSSLLPTLVGVALAPETGGASLGLTGTAAKIAPIVGGMATGAAVAGAKGDDPLMGGIMGGIGGYGGSGLGKTFATMGGGVNPYSSNLVLDQATKQGVQNIGSVQPAGIQLLKDVGVNAPLGTDQFATSLTPNLPSTNVIAGQLPSTVASGARGGLDSVLTGAEKLASDPFGKGYEAFKQAGGSPMQLAMPLGMAALSGMQEDLYPKTDLDLEARKKAEENKYRDPRTGLLNLAQASPGLKLMATGGTVGSNTSTTSSGGIQDLYGTNDQVTGTTELSKDGYGIGRLEKLASQGSYAKAADTFYAEGGPVSFADGGMAPGSDMPLAIPESQLRYMRGPTRSYSGARMGPSYSSGTGGNLMSDYFRTWQRSFPGFAAPALNNPRTYLGGPGSRVGGMRFSEGGISSFAEGGQNYLDGQGDGMSDSIPATIEGKRPARLADGEFVIPADVVSHLGNGSSKAGAKRLYTMLNKVRKARTGNPKQGKEINPNKYMPA